MSSDLLVQIQPPNTPRNRRTNAVVSALVQHIIRSWRAHFARSEAMIFNCFSLKPSIDESSFCVRRPGPRGGHGAPLRHLRPQECAQAKARRTGRGVQGQQAAAPAPLLCTTAQEILSWTDSFSIVHNLHRFTSPAHPPPSEYTRSHYKSSHKLN